MVNGVKRSSPRSKTVRLNTSSTDRQQPNRPERFGVHVKDMRCEVSSIPTTAYDPQLLPEHKTPLVVGKSWFLDHKVPVGGLLGL